MQDCHAGPAAGSQELVMLTLLQACVLLLGTQDLKKKKKRLIFHPILRKLKRYSIQKHLPTVSIKTLPLSNKY